MITGIFILDWGLMSISIFNTILMLWLGITVILTAEQRTWGVYIVGSGLLLGALFFGIHTIILGYEYTVWPLAELDFWWQVGWFPVILAPYAWYAVILWYSSFFDQRDSQLRRRHRIPFAFMTAIAAFLILLLIFEHPMPIYTQMIFLDVSQTLNIAGIPVLFLLYPPYALLCIALPIDPLLNPEPSDRVMGELARRRSRPWLLGTTLILLVVCILVSLFMLTAGLWARSHTYQVRTSPNIVFLTVFDLMLSLLIGLGTVSLGQAVISYEIFTVRTLPRRGFLRHWRNAIILSAGLSIIIGWTLIYQPLPVYSLLFMVAITVLFYALLTWRSFVHRDYLITSMRPLVNTQGLMDYLFNPTTSSQSRARTLFNAICQDLLNTSKAQLIAMGVLAPLVREQMTYRSNRPELQLPASLFASTQDNIVPLDPNEYGGFHWVVPLWSERGLSGALLLGEKIDKGLYSVEEIDIARTSAERIIDMAASEQMARQLMSIQEQRLKEQRVMDFHTRRVLHDETLPTLHTTIIQLSNLKNQHPQISESIQTLSGMHSQIAELIHTTPDALDTGETYLLVGAIQHMIQQEFQQEFNGICLETHNLIINTSTLVQNVVLGALREVLRNASLHGRGDDAQTQLNINIDFHRRNDSLIIQVRDDGIGLQAASSNNHGSGGGLALHSTMMAIVGGYLTVEPGTSAGTQVTITVPNIFAQS